MWTRCTWAKSSRVRVSASHFVCVLYMSIPRYLFFFSKIHSMEKFKNRFFRSNEKKVCTTGIEPTTNFYMIICNNKSVFSKTSGTNLNYEVWCLIFIWILHVKASFSTWKNTIVITDPSKVLFFTKLKTFTSAQTRTVHVTSYFVLLTFSHYMRATCCVSFSLLWFRLYAVDMNLWKYVNFCLFCEPAGSPKKVHLKWELHSPVDYKCYEILLGYEWRV